MIPKTWSGIKEVPYYFWRSSVKFQGNTGEKNHRFWTELGASGPYVDFPSNLACPDCNSSLNWLEAMNDAQSLM